MHPLATGWREFSEEDEANGVYDGNTYALMPYVGGTEPAAYGCPWAAWKDREDGSWETVESYIDPDWTWRIFGPIPGAQP